MTEQTDRLTVHIKYKEFEKTVSGSPEEVWLLLNKFFAELIPSFETARTLTLNVDLKDLSKGSEKIIAFAAEGPYILAPRNKLTDNETLILLLLANYLGHKLGKIASDALSKEELQEKLGKNAKITSTRLGELVKNEIAVKTTDDKFRMTTFGLVHVQKEILRKIKSRMGF